jgi:nucleotide-binding universal stress UspA family protein
MIALNRILVATDFSPPSEAALVYGRALARTFGASLHVLHLVENTFLRPMPTDPYVFVAAKHQALSERLNNEEAETLHARTIVELSDSPADAIVEYARAETIDLIVMGTHGRGAVSQLFVGSVAERVVRTAPCPVLTVRHPEHEFVVPDSPEKRGGHDSPQEDPRRN